MGGVASRREADRLIFAATTTVNGVLQMDPAFDVAEEDEVIFDGRRIKIQSDVRVIILNKPRLFTIGRRDRNSTGVLLLTNDGLLTQELMLPKNKIPRIYELEIDRMLDKSEIMKMRRGIFIGFRQKGQAKVLQQKVIKKRVLVRLELCHGKNREIRRIMAVLKRKIFSLHRKSYGPIDLKGVPVGKWRKLTKTEVNTLRKL